MKHRVEVTPAARRVLRRLPPAAVARLEAALDRLAGEPRPPGSVALTGGLSGLLRVRVGKYRIVYQVLDEPQLVRVVSIGHRRQVYRRRG